MSGGGGEPVGMRIHYDQPWPETVPLATVDVYYHDSLLVAKHGMPCGVCTRRKANLFLNDGRFYPCDMCVGRGWRLVQLGWFWRTVLRLFGVLG